MKNYIYSGKVVTITAPTDLVSGQGLLIGEMFVIVSNTVKQGDSVEVATVGVYELQKADKAQVIAGTKAYWDPTTGVVTNINSDAKDRKIIGVFCDDVPSLKPLANVRLNGTFPLAVDPK